MGDFFSKRKTDLSGSVKTLQWTCDSSFIIKVSEEKYFQHKNIIYGSSESHLLFVDKLKRHFHGLASTKETCYIAVPVARLLYPTWYRKHWQDNKTQKKRRAVAAGFGCWVASTGWGKQTEIGRGEEGGTAELQMSRSLLCFLIYSFLSIYACFLSC